MTHRHGAGWIFVPALILAVVLAFCIPAQGLEECPDPTRPIHYMPFCLSEVEWLELTAPRAAPVDPGPVSVAVVDTEAEVRVIAAYFWPAWAVDRMMRIAACETVPDWNARSLNPTSGAAGLWQILPSWKRVWPGDYFDPWTNGAVAYQIWLVQGFGAWSCTGKI